MSRIKKRNRVRKNHPFNLRLLKSRCLASIEEYHAEGVVRDTPDGQYIFKDNGAKVLAVAHLDTVQHTKHFVPGRRYGEPVFYNGQVDDRLGAHIILDVLPALGVKCDVLLTEGEEMGRSTAAHFDEPSKSRYNWMFQFDRAGTDVVMYDYETPAYEEMLTENGFLVGWGSFSDICSLRHVGCTGFNFGTGYYDNHHKNAYFVPSETWYMVRKFVKFYTRHADEFMPFAPPVRKSYKFVPNNFDGDTSKWYREPDAKDNEFAEYDRYRFEDAWAEYIQRDDREHEKDNAEFEYWPYEGETAKPEPTQAEIEGQLYRHKYYDRGY